MSKNETACDQQDQFVTELNGVPVTRDELIMLAAWIDDLLAMTPSTR